MGKRFDYEYIVIGAGAAGITAARQLVQAGHKVALIEKDKWGGAEANYRNVPQQAVSRVSNLYREAVAGKKFGIGSAGLRYSYSTLMRWREYVISKAAPTRKDLESIGIDCIQGRADFVGNYDVKITGGKIERKIKKPAADNAEQDDNNVISASKFIIATGTEMATQGISGLDKVSYYTPATILAAPQPPRTALIVGGGSSGCEVAQYLAELGTRVVLIECSGRLLPKEDEEVGLALKQYFEKQLGIKVFTNTRAVALEKDNISPRVVFMRGGQERTVKVNDVVLAVGSRPALNLGLKNVGVSYDKNGIVVDRTLQTSARNVFAAGDILGGESSTERSIYTAEVAVMNLLGRSKTFATFDGFIRTTNTDPQIASVGLSEDDLTKGAKRYKKAVVPLSATMASTTSGNKFGFIKMMADNQGNLLGATMFGPHATDVLQELALAIRHKLPLVQVASTPHPAEGWSNLVKIAARKLMADKK